MSLIVPLGEICGNNQIEQAKDVFKFCQAFCRSFHHIILHNRPYQHQSAVFCKAVSFLCYKN
jgi:hypothetical protein